MMDLLCDAWLVRGLHLFGCFALIVFELLGIVLLGFCLVGAFWGVVFWVFPGLLLAVDITCLR